MAESIDFQWPMKEACSEEIEEYCGGVPHGRGRVIRRAAPQHACLQLTFCMRPQQAVWMHSVHTGARFFPGVPYSASNRCTLLPPCLQRALLQVPGAGG